MLHGYPNSVDFWKGSEDLFECPQYHDPWLTADMQYF